MTLPTQAGTYNAYPISIAVQEPDDNKPTVVVIEYDIYEHVINGSPADMHGTSITAWHYLEKTDGTMNTYAIESLRNALGWDGADLDWLQDTDFSQHPVTIVLDWETYRGKDKLKVKWLNQFGATPGIAGKKADAASMQRINNRIGSKLRAISGGTKRPAPAPTRDPDVRVCAINEAWEVFCLACEDKGVSDNNRAIEWTRIIDDMFSGKTSAGLTGAECMKLRDEGPALIGKPGYTPPSGQDADSGYAPPPSDDEIPF